MCSGGIGTIAAARSIIVAGHGDIAGDADSRDSTADPDLRADAVNCAVDMRVPRDLLPNYAEYAARLEECRPTPRRPAEDI